MCWLHFQARFPHVVAKVTTITSSLCHTGLAVPEDRNNLFPSEAHKSPQMTLDLTRLSHVPSPQHQCSRRVFSLARPRSGGSLPCPNLMPGNGGGVVHQRKNSSLGYKNKKDVLQKRCQSSFYDGGEDSDKEVPERVTFELN